MAAESKDKKKERPSDVLKRLMQKDFTKHKEAKKKKREEEDEEDESVNPPVNVTGSY